MRQIVVNLGEPPPAGKIATIVRLRLDDRNDIVRAANALGMKVSEFHRTAVIHTARRVLEELPGDTERRFRKW